LSSGWISSPAFDLLFLANLLWPVALLPLAHGPGGEHPLAFWQVYFLTVPHRWLTLGLVVFDPDRREGRDGAFAWMAGGVAFVLLGVYSVTGDFPCLLLADFLWNGWHFASQHSGVLAIYARKAGTSRPLLERWGLRLFICYAIYRIAGWATSWLVESPFWLDLAMLALPIWLVGGELAAWPWRLPKLAYLASVCGLYTGLLLAVSFGQRSLVLSLALAGALFHATEYLAVVTCYAWGRRAGGSDGLFRQMAQRWLYVLGLFVAVVGVTAVLAEAGAVPDWWIGLNLWASFLHYAYDGMIWRLRRPATARALGATV
jgi:hypothetical protein